MAYSEDDLNFIYDRSGGYCHLCRKKLSFTNYGRHGERGAWEVDHSVARARRGTERRNNLYAACTSCNRSKGASCTRTVRARNGHTRAPMCTDDRRWTRTRNRWVAAAVGGIGGWAAASNPFVALVGAGLGLWIGGRIKPE